MVQELPLTYYLLEPVIASKVPRMDPVRNPFAPGAGSRPPELAGREEIIADARIALQRAKIGNFTKSQILLGLRGTGKTVLLNEIERISEEIGHITSYIEAPDDRSLASILHPKAQQALKRLSNIESAKHAALNSPLTKSVLDELGEV